jgi:Tol biopolymer transport system component
MERNFASAAAFVLLCGCNALVGIDPPTIRTDGDASDAESSDAEAGDADGAGTEDATGEAQDAAGETRDASSEVDDAASEADDGRGGDAGPTDATRGPTSLGILTRVSVSSEGTQADDSTAAVSVSGDGKLVAFSSVATNLVLFDRNAHSDVFLYDRTTSDTLRASVGSDNAEANDDCNDPIVTTDGMYVFFTSAATNFAGTAMNGTQQLFSRWLAASRTDHRSRGTADSIFRPAVSSDGSLVAFETNAAMDANDVNDESDIYAIYGARFQFARISIGASGVEPNAGSTEASVSANGSLFAFSSYASNLVADDTNDAGDVFVRGLTDTNVIRVSVSSNGVEGNAASGPGVISGDGRRVAFCSNASNLVPDDTNGVLDVFVHDLTTHQTVRVSVSSTGAQGDGRSCNPSLSGDGRFVAFDSLADNLVPDDVAFPGDTNYADVFVHDLVTGVTVRLSAPPTGRANGDSFQPAMSANGRVVAFLSSASNLVLGDTNGRTDAFAFEFADTFPPPDAGPLPAR